MGTHRISREEFRRHADEKARERGEQPDQLPLKDVTAMPYPVIVDDTQPGWQTPDTLKKIKKTTHDAIQTAISTKPRITASAIEVMASMGMDSWPGERVWDILWNATETDVLAHPAYHVALLRRARRSEGFPINVTVTKTEHPKPDEGPKKGRKARNRKNNPP